MNVTELLAELVACPGVEKAHLEIRRDLAARAGFEADEPQVTDTTAITLTLVNESGFGGERRPSAVRGRGCHWSRPAPRSAVLGRRSVRRVLKID